MLIALTAVAIALVIVLISVARIHPFLALLIASLFLAVVTGIPLNKVITAYETGVGGTLGHLAGIVGLGAILGKLLADSGGADRLSQWLTGLFGARRLPWAMMVLGLIIGVTVFFEVGVVLLIPIILTVVRRSRQPVLLVGIPVLAGLSVTHGLVPPHPGALIAVDAYSANIGLTILYGLIVAIPSAIVAGPLLGRWLTARVHPTGELGRSSEPGVNPATPVPEQLQPSLGATLLSVLFPIALMLLATAAQVGLPAGRAQDIISFIGNPVIALLLGVLLAYRILGSAYGASREVLLSRTGQSLLPLAGILLIIGAGGGFKNILIESGVGKAIADLAVGANWSPLVLAYLIAALVRVATGSATVALTTTAGLMTPILARTSGVSPELLVLATGAGSLILSHVNDAGFWLVKEYLGMDVKETLQTWTVMETVLSLVAFAIVMGLSLVV
ncbi:high-affinity gluconate transporter [Deinococcus carri]|uniref:High-affinity gluconate transporter n=1 Tax=Deinococcus carri TaxID=1211323 RepID=A0ABP9WE11_9DEIO